MVAYPVLCSWLRNRRLKGLQNKFKYGTSEHPSYEGMTVKEAHDIIDVLSGLEFPALFEKGLQLALFRTYGIPTISELLVKTTQLSATKNVPKRYADTGILLEDMYSAEPDSERSYEAYARLKYLHGHYINQGKISNDDLLYALSLFMNQPVEWINRYEWREVSDLEVLRHGGSFTNPWAMGCGSRLRFCHHTQPGGKMVCTSTVSWTPGPRSTRGSIWYLNTRTIRQRSRPANSSSAHDPVSCTTCSPRPPALLWTTD